MSDANKRICLNKSVLDFMDGVLTPKSLVLEFGGGWSSKWFAERCGQLLVIETSFKWAKLIKQEVGKKGHVLIPRVGLFYTKDLRRMLGGVDAVDLVLIDCVGELRIAATQFAWPLVKSGGWLLFDDAQRHEVAVGWLNEVSDLQPYERTRVPLTWRKGDVESARERLTLAWQK